MIWDQLVDCQEDIIQMFNARGTEIDEPGMDHFNQADGSWINRVWENEHVRRAHIDVVDARDTKGPIYGFDVIAGKTNMTGAFHDFSASSG